MKFLRSISLSLSSILLFPLFVQGEVNHVISPVDVVNLKHVLDPQVSPDGKLIAYVVDTPVAAAREQKDSHIWIVPSQGSGQARPFTMSAVAETTPRWSPDGKMLAFLSDREIPLQVNSSFSLSGTEGRKDLELPNSADKGKSEEKPTPQIWLVTVDGGEALPLTNIPGGVKTFKWSPDGKSIAFIRADQLSKAEKEQKKNKNDERLIDRDYKFDRLWIYKLDSHQARLVTKSDTNIDDFDWSPDGTQFLVRMSKTPLINDYWRVSKVVTISAATGETTKTLCEHAFSLPVQWSPDGRYAAFSQVGPKSISGIPSIYDFQSGKITEVGKSYTATVTRVQWSADGKAVSAYAIEGTHGVFLKVNLSNGEVKKFSETIGYSGTYSQSKDGAVTAFLGQNFNHTPEVWTLIGDKAEVRTETNKQTESWKVGKVQEISWKSSKDGRTIYGALVLPADYVEGQKYKTILQAHGGPEGFWGSGWLGSWHDWAQMLSSHGYAVLLPNPRGSMGQGTSFSDANFEDWGGGDFQDVMDGVDFLVKKGIADPERLGVGGWSYGGFMTSWTVTHTDRFKAAIVGAGVTDLFSMATTTDIAPDFLSGYFGDVFAHRDLYDKHSPMRYIEQCHTPTLIIHGDSDVRVPPAQGEEFYYSLKFLGRETQMVRYPREPHVFAEREHQQNLLEHVLDWYESHLGK